MKAVRDWPALMKPLTARAYLDDMPADKFSALVVPHLDSRTTGGMLRFTRKSLDDWIDASGGAREVQTPEALGRLLDDDDGAHLGHQALRQQRHDVLLPAGGEAITDAQGNRIDPIKQPDEFAARVEAMKAKLAAFPRPKAKAGYLLDLIEAWRGIPGTDGRPKRDPSPEWLQLSLATRKSYERMIDPKKGYLRRALRIDLAPYAAGDRHTQRGEDPEQGQQGVRLLDWQP